MELNTIKEIIRNHEHELILPDEHLFTAIMIPLIETDNGLEIVFEVRSSNVSQPNEVSFPGGYLENDETFIEAAIRETSEELLIHKNQIEVLGPLHRSVNRGRLIIDSCLGLLHDYQYTYNPDEVSQIFTIPLDTLIEKQPQIYEGKVTVTPNDDFPFDLIPNGRNYQFKYPNRLFYFYVIDDHVIWGLTADLLYRFINIIKNVK